MSANPNKVPHGLPNEMLDKISKQSDEIPQPIDARFDTTDPNLCPALRWKGQFILAEPDPTVPRSNDGLFWCLHTQTCIGPDGELAEPGNCASSSRPCHGSGKCG